MFRDGSRPAQEHPGSCHVLFIRMLPGHTLWPRTWLWELEAPALSQALELSLSCRADTLIQGPFVACAEPVPAWWQPLEPHTAEDCAAGRAPQRKGMADGPIRLILPGSPRRAFLGGLIPQISSHPAHPTLSPHTAAAHGCSGWEVVLAGRAANRKRAQWSITPEPPGMEPGLRIAAGQPAERVSRCWAGKERSHHRQSPLATAPTITTSSRRSCQAGTEEDLPCEKRSPGGALNWEN